MARKPDTNRIIDDFSALSVAGKLGETVSVILHTDLIACQQDGYRYGKGVALAVAKPKTIIEVQAVLAYCRKHRICVIPQGGNTGLVGASVPDGSGRMLVLSTALLNPKQIILNTENQTVTAGAGVILQALNDTLQPMGMTLPIDIGAKESCQIGGLLATNAAGTRAGRYGNVTSQTVSYTVALPDGSLETHQCTPRDTKAGVMQDNSMIDLSQPFLGSGGAFGVIVEATLRVTHAPKASETALIIPKSSQMVVEILAYLKEKLGERLTAFESMDDASMRLASQHLKVPYPLAHEQDLVLDLAKNEEPLGLIIEISSVSENHEALHATLWSEGGIIEQLAEKGWIIAAPRIPARDIWHVRHHISDAIRRRAMVDNDEDAASQWVISHDISVTSGMLSDFEQQAKALLVKKYGDQVEIYAFGHRMIDAVHFNIIWHPDNEKALTPRTRQNIRHAILELAISKPFCGSVSAEHGLGPHTADEIREFCLEDAAGKSYVKAVKALKKRYDPYYIMNPMVDAALGIADFAAKQRK